MKTLKRILKHLMLVLPIVLATSCGNDNPEKILKEAAIEVNNNCPQRVDEITVMKEVSYENHTFLYVYELDESIDADVFMDADQDVLERVLNEELRDKAEVNSDVKAFLDELRKDNAKLIYRYVLKDGSGRSRDIPLDY